MLPTQAPVRRIVIILFAAVPLLFGMLALLLGQDSDWDLRNYHWYNAFAALQGRLDIDMGAAQTPTFYNPTLDIPFFVLARAVPGMVVAFILGAVQGCNFILLYLLASLTLRLPEERQQAAAAALLAIVGMLGGGHVPLVGTVFYDNVVSLFVFAAALVVLRSAAVLEKGALAPALMRAVLAGFCVGCAVGLKLPTQIYAVGLCFGFLFVPGPFWRRFRLSFVCGLGIIAGFLLLGGWWMWALWTHFANPLFPYFNQIIASPWAMPDSYRDTRFAPETALGTLLLPLRIFVNGHEASEIGFRDGRILMAYLALLATPCLLLLRRRAPMFVVPVNVFALRYLSATFVLSYLAWLVLFGIYRYAIVLEMLGPLITVGCIAFWPWGRTGTLRLAAAALAFMVLTTVPGTWGRVPWAGLAARAVQVEAPVLDDPATSMVIMSGFAPTSFTIPAFAPGPVFLRAESYLVEPDQATRFNDTLRARVAAHRGSFYALQAIYERPSAQRVLGAYGLAVDIASCRPLPTNIDPDIEFCRAQRTAP